MMFLSYLILITALCLSAIAAYYSIIGLIAIFAAAVIPIAIMGTALEVSKLVTTVWLHEYWDRAKLKMKLYLVPAVVVLMFITSMGIFGFLSKSHIEQTTASQESVALVERNQKEIGRLQGIIARAEQKIEQAQTTGTGADTNIQAQIDKEQERIDSAYDRVQPLIDEQNQIVAGVTALYQSELDKIDTDLSRLQGFIDNGEIAKAQAMVGSQADGKFGPKTAEAFTNYQTRKGEERLQWVQKIQDAANSPTVKAAREEIARLRGQAEAQIAQSNELINRLRSQLGQDTGVDIDAVIDEQNQKIKAANAEIDTLTEETYALEAEYRKLEAEVGPVKYIAEMIYGEADRDLLEEAVRWVIIIIVVVFDPLAIMMLLAATESFGWAREQRNERQQIESTGTTPHDGVHDADQDQQTESDSDPDPGADEDAGEKVPGEVDGTRDSPDTAVEPTSESADGEADQEVKDEAPKLVFPVPEPLDPEEFKHEDIQELGSAQDIDINNLDNIESNLNNLEEIKEYDDEDHRAETREEEQQNVETFRNGQDQKSIQGETPDDPTLVAKQSTVDVQSPDPDERDWEYDADGTRIYKLDAGYPTKMLVDDEDWDVVHSGKLAKKIWKANNPDDTLKRQERLLDNGRIDEVPWHQLKPIADDLVAGDISFGIKFPEEPIKGDTYIRVDFLPTKLFKFNGQNWIEVNKENTDSFTYNEEYIDHLIEKLGSGEYDPEMLNDNERDQIEARLKDEDK